MICFVISVDRLAVLKRHNTHHDVSIFIFQCVVNRRKKICVVHTLRFHNHHSAHFALHSANRLAIKI